MSARAGSTDGYYGVSVKGRIVAKYGPGQNRLARLRAVFEGGRVVWIRP